jgi:hypothetical protein
MHTKTAKKIAEERTEFIELFLNQLLTEILPKYRKWLLLSSLSLSSSNAGVV